MYIFNIISLFGGLALFLYGMRIMGDGLKKESTGSFKTALEKVTNNPFMGFLIGAGLTGIIQSATATIVIVSGLVGAGIMTLTQSIGVILGANVGTTITGQIIRLLDVNSTGAEWLNIFKPSTLAPVAAIVGIIFVMFIQTKKSGTIGSIAMGFGILFTGLLNMTEAVSPLSNSPLFVKLFTSFGDKPVLGFLAGFAVAFILQSSSATIGILQALSVTGALTFAAVYPIICGIYLGDCVTTAIVCSIGTSPDAKRTGAVNILFNLSEIVIISVAVNIIHSVGGLSSIWGSVLNSGGIANTHTVFNLSCAILLLPLTKTYGKIATKLIKDNAPEDIPPEIAALDERLFTSPALALNSVYMALTSVMDVIDKNLKRSEDLLDKYDESIAEDIHKDERHVDRISDAANNYLVKLSPHLNINYLETSQHYYLQCIIDLERAADHTYEVSKCAGLISEMNISFSKVAEEQLAKSEELLDIIVKYTKLALKEQNLQAAKEILPHCEVLGNLIDNARAGHFDRMVVGECDNVSGPVFLDILMHLGRIADMCSNIGIHTLARHNGGLENFEHEYVHHLRHGDDDMFNARIIELERSYIKND